MKRFSNLIPTGIVFTSVIMIVVCVMGTQVSNSARSDRDDASRVGSVIAADGLKATKTTSDSAQAADPAQESSSPSHAAKNLHPVIVRQPSGPPLIELAGVDPQGRSGKVACSTCHSVRKPNLANRTSKSLDEFHQGLTFDHGKLACYACHNPENSDTLRLADGTAVQYRDVKDLCSQCHSAQAEAFEHGAHGGMTGFWDLSQGPQKKNNCVDCHDPHVPEFPKMIVGFKPRDRFLEAEPKHDDH